MTVSDDITFLRLPAVRAATGLSRSSVYAAIKRSDGFPKPIRLPGTRVSVWRSDEIRNWINQTIERAESA